MTESTEIASQSTGFAQVLDAAAKLPSVRINRAAYLRTALKRYCTEEQIEQAVTGSPAAAGIPLKVITDVANTSITYETSKVTGLSAIAGIPGGLAMIGTVPADLVQYMGHMLRVSQKLAYIYGWPDLFADEGEELDEATENLLILFVGVMFGVQIAHGAVSKVAGMVAANVATKLPQQALTKGVIYPIVKKVSAYLGVSMTKKLFAGGIAKAVPVLGAVVSGGITLGTFLTMAKRLQRHLVSLELTKPGHRSTPPPE
ncbi:EcsC family protein [Microbacterium sp. zg-YB36]|uniref:EcsC family protein n=1 Tax=Microbacterium sp. zg-YB36 TaxID=2969407 RepID=UPI00214B3B42|nr:EcsC family protein [Microbacterium sp. zg-YB36]MDL5350953.1 EcsC family protein [Microbacterium sp. zg-YB36]